MKNHKNLFRKTFITIALIFSCFSSVISVYAKENHTLIDVVKKKISRTLFSDNSNNNLGDYTPPVLNLETLKVSKKSIGRNESVEISVEVTDDLSGVGSVFCYYSSPISGKSKSMFLHHASGNIYSGSFNTDEYEEVGKWTIKYISVNDNKDNWIYYYNKLNYGYGNICDLSAGDIIVNRYIVKEVTHLCVEKKETISLSYNISSENIDNKLLVENENRDIVSAEIDNQNSKDGEVYINFTGVSVGNTSVSIYEVDTNERIYLFNVECSEHYWNWLEQKNNSCEDDGYDIYECDLCGKKNIVIQEKTGHDWFEYNKQTRTCEEDGWIEYECVNCMEHKIEITEYAIGHKFHFDRFDYWYDEELDELIDVYPVYSCEKKDIIEEWGPYPKWYVNKDLSYEPTCENEGKKVWTIEISSDKSWDGKEHIEESAYELVKPALGHDWGETTYTWSEDNSTVTAKRICNRDPNHIEAETVETTATITKEATCEDKGETTYTTKPFTNNAFIEQSKTLENIDALGHDITFDGFTYMYDTEEKVIYDAWANYSCKRNDCYKSDIYGAEYYVNNNLSYEATCENEGKTVWTIELPSKYSPDGIEQIEESVLEITKPALEHDWGEPKYKWSDDYSTVAATHLCKRDSSHIETESVETTSLITKKATCDENGKTIYTTKPFSNLVFTEQSITVEDIDALGHDWGKPIYEWSNDNKTVTAKMVCRNDRKHIIVETAKTTERVIKEANVLTEGEIEYFAQFNNSNFNSCTKTVKTPKKERTGCVQGKDNITNFVTRLYELCLNRCPDASGLSYWSDALKSGRQTAAQVAKGFFESNEMKKLNLSNEEFVKRCYRVMMNREADNSGKAYWMDRLTVGMSRLSVVKGFVASNEFTKICQDYKVTKGNIDTVENRDLNYGVTAFITRCFKSVLGRGYDVNGLNYWTGRIMDSANKKEAAVSAASSGFFNSNEFKNKGLNDADFIRVCYRTFLDREADAGGLNYWLGRMSEGKDVILKGFANSNEFSAIMARFGIR